MTALTVQSNTSISEDYFYHRAAKTTMLERLYTKCFLDSAISLALQSSRSASITRGTPLFSAGLYYTDTSQLYVLRQSFPLSVSLLTGVVLSLSDVMYRILCGM